jgi:hypothetical protein
MKEGLEGHGAVEIGRLREQIVGLADADRIARPTRLALTRFSLPLTRFPSSFCHDL